MDLEFTGNVWEWRGPSPFYFVTVPVEESAQIEAASAMVTYGWGRIEQLVDGALCEEWRLRRATQVGHSSG
jgi:hypothetical protein